MTLGSIFSVRTLPIYTDQLSQEDGCADLKFNVFCHLKHLERNCHVKAEATFILF